MNRLPADYVKTSHKLTFLAMIAIITLMGPVCPLSAQNDRPVHISVRNEPLSKVLKNIEKQSGYLFFYNTKEVDPRRRLSLELSGSDIRETAEHIAKILGLTYSIKGRHIVFTPTVTATADQAGKVGITSLYGMVTDSKGRPLPGVTAIISGTNRGTTTDAGGKYSMEVRQGASVDFSMIGYIPQSVTATTDSPIDIQLREDIVSMEDVIVIGYGQVLRSDFTGSVAQVKMPDIESIPVVNVDQMLQGRMAGVEIMSTSGEPGAVTSIRIRGTRSINASNEPLFVVDGAIDAIHDLNDINPGDIRSIEVLKDASSTAIYGSRGSNGVIIITTMQGGGKQADRFTFRSDIGFSQLPGYLDLMNATEFAKFRNDYFYFNTPGAESMPMDRYPYPDPESLGEGTDWTRSITRTAPYQNYHLSASGGDGSWKYYASASYNNTQGVIQNSGLQRWQARLNLSRRFNSRLTSGINAQYTHIGQELNKAEIGSLSYWYRSAIYLAPTIPVYKTDGSLNDWNEFANSNGGLLIDTPVAYVQQMTKRSVRRSLNLNWNIEYEPMKDLKLKSRISFYNFDRNTDHFYPGSMPARLAQERGAKAYKAKFQENNVLNENTITYNKTFNSRHTVDILGGFTAQKFWDSSLAIEGEGYPSDQHGTDNIGAIPDKNNLITSSAASEKLKYSALFRVGYNLAGKYYFTFTARADGASNFAKSHRWGYFPSAAARWNISREDFLSGYKWLDELSLRLSGGVSGNDAISNYQSLSALAYTTTGYIFGESIPVAFYPIRIGNEKLTWEKTSSYNLGLDIGLFGNRLRITLDGYLSYTRDLLLSVQKPSHTGYADYFTNIGRTSNRGIELTIFSRNIHRKNFSWESTFTFSRNRQRVDDIGGEDMVIAYESPNSKYAMMGYMKGYPLNALWGFKYGGTWKDRDEISRNDVVNVYVSPYPSYYSPGRPRYIDRNNDGRLDKNDLFYLGNSDPFLYGGIQNSFSIYGFRVNVYFNYSLGGKLYNISELYMGTGSLITNQYKYMSDSWHPVRNPGSDLPIPNSQDNIPNDRFVHDASFLRLKNLSVSYTLDTEKLTGKWLKDITVSVSGNNIWLWKKYNGYDPEVSTSRVGSTLRRMDDGAYPSNRTIVFSLQFRH